MKLIKLSKIHQGKYLSYYVADYLMNKGHIKSYELVSRDPSLTIDTFGNNKPAGVGLVPFSTDREKVLLQKEFRLATNRWVYNFPAGLIDKNETCVEAAKREIVEETGTHIVDIIDVLSPSFASQGTSDEMMNIVICTCEGNIKESIYEEEEIMANWYTKEDVRKLLKEGAYMSVRTQMFLWQWVNKDKY